MADERNQIKLIHLYLHNLESLLFAAVENTHTGLLRLLLNAAGATKKKKKSNHSVQTELLFTDVQSQVFFFFLFFFIFFFNSSLVCRRLWIFKREVMIFCQQGTRQRQNPGVAPSKRRWRSRALFSFEASAAQRLCQEREISSGTSPRSRSAVFPPLFG